MVAGLIGVPSETLIVGLDHGDDAAAVRLDGNGTAVLSTVDFFTPVVDDAYDWGRIAAANAFSDIYAMGGRPILAVNLVCWPRDLLPMTLAADVLRGGLAVAIEAECPVAGGHSVDDPEPKYGMAVTGLAPCGSPAPHRRGRRRPTAVTEQTARDRRAQQPAQADRRGIPARGGHHGRAQPCGVRSGARRRRALRDRRHRVRSPRSSVQAGAGEQPHRRYRRRRRAVPRGCARSPRRRIRERRHPPQPRVGRAARRMGAVARQTTSASGSCSPTRRRAVACSSPARFRDHRSSASLYLRGPHVIEVR